MIINLQDTQLYVEESGQGNPLLLIHGYPFNHEMWHPQIEAFSTSARIIAPDLRGHGGSPPSNGPSTMDLLADDCAKVLETLGVDEPVTVCGLSMGGYVAFALYRRYPSLVAGLILAATRAKADSPEIKVKRDESAALAEENGVQAVTANMLPIIMSPKTYSTNPELVDRVEQIMVQTSLQGMVSALMGMKVRPDSTPMLDAISVPTLIIHGSDDQIIPLSEAEAMHASIKDSQFEIIADAGHLPNLEQAELFNQSVKRFLDLTKS
jgi:3-oxoadipate enol-lactonase